MCVYQPGKGAGTHGEGKGGVAHLTDWNEILITDSLIAFFPLNCWISSHRLDFLPVICCSVSLTCLSWASVLRFLTLWSKLIVRRCSEERSLMFMFALIISRFAMTRRMNALSGDVSLHQNLCWESQRCSDVQYIRLSSSSSPRQGGGGNGPTTVEKGVNIMCGAQNCWGRKGFGHIRCTIVVKMESQLLLVWQNAKVWEHFSLDAGNENLLSRFSLQTSSVGLLSAAKLIKDAFFKLK